MAEDSEGGADAAREAVESRPDRRDIVADRTDALFAVAQRAFDTVVRTRSYAVLGVVYTIVVLALPLASDVGGYIPLVLDLSTPVEVLVPLLALAFGTWSVLADAHSGELEVIRTYPVSRWTYVLGTFLGRAVGLLVAVLTPLVLVGVAVPVLQEPSTSVFVSHETVDSPIYFVRFVALAGVYALVTLALAMAISSLGRSRRFGVAAAALVALVLVVGLDALAILGVANGVFGGDSLSLVLAASPPGAFRGLVLATATGGVVSTGAPVANVAASAIGLAAWFLVGITVAAVRVWSPGGQ